MMLRVRRIVVILALLIVQASAVALAAGPKTASAPASSASKPQHKFPPVTTQQAQKTREQAIALFERTRKEIAPELHQVETEHFLIFSAWDRSNDKPLGETCEQLYQVLLKQFEVPAKEDVWVGKLPMFVLKPEQFIKFAEADKVNVRAAGYCRTGRDLSYVVLQTPQQKEFFFEVLAHETTHVFNSRYEGPRHLPQWLDEGIADSITCTLLPKGGTARRAPAAMKQAIREGRDIEGVFASVDLNDFDYGIARSIVEYLAARDRKGFLKMISLLKSGQSEEAALKESFGLTREQLVNDWKAAAAKAIR